MESRKIFNFDPIKASESCYNFDISNGGYWLDASYILALLRDVFVSSVRIAGSSLYL